MPITNSEVENRQKWVKKCCFATTGGPWPRNFCLDISRGKLADEIITIEVGSGHEQVTFQWLKSILEFHSSFFTSALNDSFREAEDRIISLPEDDADVFAEFIRWITDHRLGGYGPISSNPQMTAISYLDLLSRLYIFADKYNMTRLQNVVIDALIITFAETEVFFTPATIAYIYRNTMAKSPLRELVVNFVVITYTDVTGPFRDMTRNGMPYCQEFTEAVFCKYVSCVQMFSNSWLMETRLDWKRVNRCTYHVAEPEPQYHSRR